MYFVWIQFKMATSQQSKRIKINKSGTFSPFQHKEILNKSHSVKLSRISPQVNASNSTHKNILQRSIVSTAVTQVRGGGALRRPLLSVYLSLHSG